MVLLIHVNHLLKPLIPNEDANNVLPSLEEWPDVFEVKEPIKVPRYSPSDQECTPHSCITKKTKYVLKQIVT